MLLETVRDKSLVVVEHMQRLAEFNRKELELRDLELQDKAEPSDKEKTVIEFLRGADKNTINAVAVKVS